MKIIIVVSSVTIDYLWFSHSVASEDLLGEGHKKLD